MFYLKMRKSLIFSIIFAIVGFFPFGFLTLNGTNAQTSGFEFKSLLEKNFQNIEFRGKIYVSVTGLNFSAQFSAFLVSKDSVKMSFYGPMGVILARVFANNTYFQYYDVFNNWAVVGLADREHIFEASRIPLSFADIINLFVGLPIQPFDSLKISNEYSNGKILFFHRDTSFVDFYLVSDEKQQILQFQRKDTTDKVVMNLLYLEYQEFSNTFFPKKYKLELPERSGYVIVEIEKINSFELDGQPFSFKIPKNVELIEFFE